TDSTGTVGRAETATATLNSTVPTGYTIAADNNSVNATGATSTGFTFTGATVCDTYKYTINSSGGGTAITGSGTVSSATENVDGINVTSLSNGTLTYSVTLTNSAGNAGPAATATATLDTTL